MLKGTYACPVCKKSTLGEDQQKYVNQFIQQQVDLVQMGEAGEREVMILCNDCGEKNQTKFHIVAHKCPKCESFNTAMITK